MIYFIGVWDIVGVLGIFNDMEFFNLLDNFVLWCFYDIMFGKYINIVRYVMVMDEKRSSFCVICWIEYVSDCDVKEKWFLGVYFDVGGGYSDIDLLDIIFEWMLKEVVEVGLVFRDGIFE